MKIFWSVLGLSTVLVMIGPVRLQAGSPTLEHQPPTGLTTSSKGVDVKPDGQGGTIISPRKPETTTSKDGATTTTKTVTKTNETQVTKIKDKTTQETTTKTTTKDSTITKTETKTTAKDQHGNQYDKTKTSETTKTTRTTDPDGKTTTTTTKEGHTFNFKEPNGEGVSKMKDSKVSSEKLENKPDESETRTYTNDDGHQVTVTKHPEEGTTTQTDMGNGKTHSVNEKGDGTKTVTVKEGKKQSTTEHYDKDGKLIKTEKTDKNGETTTEYPDPNKPEGENSSFGGSGEENPFGDDLGMNGTPGGSSMGRDMAVANDDHQREDHHDY